MTIQSKYTPGPWVWNKEYSGLMGENNDCVLSYADYEGMWVPYYLPQGGANARLIAVAPELLEALQAIMELRSVSTLFEAAMQYPHDKEDVRDEIAVLRKANKAIAKARGQS